MRRFQKAIFVFGVMFLLSSLAVPIGYAQIIPAGPAVKIGGCDMELEVNKEAFQSLEGLKAVLKKQSGLPGGSDLESILGCAIKTGRLKLYMVPFYITYLIQFLLSLAGLIAILFMVIGGYKYVIGGLTEDKESGKKTILHALVGFIVALSAWIVVNFIQVALTS